MRRGRIMLSLMLLALTLPSAAVAGTIRFHVGEGGISTHFTNPFKASLNSTGFAGIFLTLDTSSITPDGCPSDECTFSSGSMDLEVEFKPLIGSSLFDGKIFHYPSDPFSLNYITARIRGGRGIPFGGTLEASFDTKGHSIVTGEVVIVTSSKSFPEPSTPEGLLLGTGALAFVEIARRKLKLGT